ncbi:diadenosine tetraphosphatase [Piscirickettsia salmonis]|uniref:symmetrical bis(5'-nucleosyl)-tetraphosphatase n=1 Tax=Piscirickettsia salmonis TaxID=1238 RepID=UPI00094A22DD|nr:symmetrical bis(5'-nucleosyl)-tetraphosphatase [Piscirickettsia salmonis]APS51796.1 diadenosine tetraphosphatase [Piscirickettsia salmonis]APS55014.1 diadenosine tetraphosphatase [Piscirickettsia salmonis]
MATYAIGDVQGCYDPLQRLLGKINYDKDQDCLWFAGDLINRGPQSLESLRFIKSVKNSIVVLGNHDLHLLAAFYGHGRKNKKDTLNEVLTAPDSQELIDWLRKQPLIHYSRHFNACMIHAGIAPQWSLQNALHYAGEVHKLLQNNEQCKHVMAGLYGNHPNCWHKDLSGAARVRFIINTLTRTRFVNNKKCLDLKTKGKIHAVTKSLSPWFQHLDSSWSGVDIIFGHWAALEGQSGLGHIHALDTGCVWGGQLTAIRLEDKQRFSVSA